MVCFDWSGNSSTRRPFASRYSVMPSTEVTRSGAAGAATGGGAGGAFGFFAAQAGAANAASNVNDARKRWFVSMPALRSAYVHSAVRPVFVNERVPRSTGLLSMSYL